MNFCAVRTYDEFAYGKMCWYFYFYHISSVHGSLFGSLFVSVISRHWHKLQYSVVMQAVDLYTRVNS